MPAELSEADNLREAVREDRARLQRFTCTEPSKKHYSPGLGKVHPRIWELSVQTWFRSRSAPVRRAGESLVVIERHDEIIAACHYGFFGDGDEWIIMALARSLSVAGTGCGGLILDVVIALCEQAGPDMPILTKIDQRNEPSINLFESRGFIRTGEVVNREPMMMFWAREARDL